MILKEWGEIRQLYKACRPRKAIWADRSVWVLLILVVLSILICTVLYANRVLTKAGFGYCLVGLVVVALFEYFFIWRVKFSLAKEFQVEYATLKLDSYPYTSPFAPSISHFLNFKLPVERST